MTIEEERMRRAKTSAILLSLLLMAGNLLAVQSTQVAELKNISYEKKDNQIHVKIEYPPNIPYDSFSLMNPNRLVLDFMGIRTVMSQAMIEIDQMGILSIRSALNRPGVARVVFNFTDDVPQYRIEETESGLTLTFWEEEKYMVRREPEQLVQETVKPPVEERIKPKPMAKKPIQPETKQTRYVDETAVKTKKNMSLGFSAGYLTLQDDVFTETYGEGGVFFKGEYAVVLPMNVESFDIWTGFTLFQMNGKTSITQEDLKLKITNLSVALRYLHTFSKFTPFAGAGIDYIVYKEILPEDYMIGSVGGSDLGFHIQGGVYYNALPYLSLKVHIKYLWSKADADGLEVNLGGVEYGAGLVFRFNL
jgi:outer membrane protein W